MKTTIFFLLIALILSGCASPAVALAPTATSAPMVPAATAAPTQPASVKPGEITLDLAGIAQNKTVETVAAIKEGADVPVMGKMPEHRLITLQGYPVVKHSMQPQIFIYPVAALNEYNPSAGKMATNLQDLLQTRGPADPMPYLPLINAKQIIHPQVQYLDFKNGKGVRYLAQYNTGFVMINNVQLVYMFQGLTADGKYYLSAILPVSHPDLPDSEQIFSTSTEDLKGYTPYLAKTAGWLDQQPGSSFTPDLSKLDAMMQSIEVK